MMCASHSPSTHLFTKLFHASEYGVYSSLAASIQSCTEVSDPGLYPCWKSSNGVQPQLLMTTSKSPELTKPLPHASGDTSGAHTVGGEGHTPHPLITARRSAVLTMPSWLTSPLQP